MRFYCENIQEGRLELPRSESHHLISVYRGRAGTEVQIFDGKGTVGWGKLAEVKNKTAVLDIYETRTYRRKYKSKIIIASSIAKSDKFEKVIKGCTELGVDGIAAVIFDRTVKKPKGKNTIRRWNKLIIESAKQCERVFLPQIIPPVDFEEYFSHVSRELDNPLFIFGDLGQDLPCPGDVYKPDRDCVVFVGPEGGFSDREISFFRENRIAAVCINDNILRIETAATAFAALLADLRRNSNR